MQPLAVVWDDGDHRYWCVAFFQAKNDDSTYEVDNLAGKKNSNGSEWVRPAMDDVQNVLPQFIIPCEVCGNWDYTRRISTFVVENVAEINEYFQDFHA